MSKITNKYIGPEDQYRLEPVFFTVHQGDQSVTIARVADTLMTPGKRVIQAVASAYISKTSLRSVYTGGNWK